MTCMNRLASISFLIVSTASALLHPCKAAATQDSDIRSCSDEAHRQFRAKLVSAIEAQWSQVGLPHPEPLRESDLMVQTCSIDLDAEPVIVSAAYDAARDATELMIAPAADTQSRMIVTVRTSRPRPLLIATRNIMAGQQIAQRDV